MNKKSAKKKIKIKVYEIFPPEDIIDVFPPVPVAKKVAIRIEKKKIRFSDFWYWIRKPLLRIICFLTIISLNWFGLSAVISTFAYLNDTENSSGNSFTAGTLDFSLDSQSDFSPVCITNNEPTTRIVTFLNHGNIPKYKVRADNFSGLLCPYLNLEASLDGGNILYSGKLTDFIYGPVVFEEPDNWSFTLKLATDAPESIQGENCQFNFVFFGSQTRNDLEFGLGFNDTEEITNTISAKTCHYAEIRSKGYWKNHSSVYIPHLPQTLGNEAIDTVAKVNQVFDDYELSMQNKLKGQLLAMKFNIAHFGIGDYYVESQGKTLNQLVIEADNLLRQNPPPSNSVLETMKNLLDKLNNLEKLKYCSGTIPDECDLQLTKTASADQVKPGDTITYHLTLDNIGNKVCTGGGVLLKDTFDKSLTYLDYTSTRKPNSFNKSLSYLQWNFGSIYPEDSLIEIDLRMKVSGCAKCNTDLINSAQFWSNETDWSDSVIASGKIICQSIINNGIVINEFLSNPVGDDKLKKPKGEWIELYNTSSETIDVKGWVLYDNHNRNELPITPTNTNTGGTTIEAGKFLVVYRNGDYDFALNNTGGDSVRLFNGEVGHGAKLIDSYTYTINAPEGKSFARIPDGSNNWVDPEPTPGEPNILNDEEETFGSAISELDEVVTAEEILTEGIEEAGLIPEASSPAVELLVEALTPKECELGQTQACDTAQLGICAAGTQTCSQEGLWNACFQDNEPGTEICSNGSDDDCNGLTDCDDNACKAEQSCVIPTETPTEETPTEEIPTEVPVEEIPAEETPIEEQPVEEPITEEPSTEEETVPTEPVLAPTPEESVPEPTPEPTTPEPAPETTP